MQNIIRENTLTRDEQLQNAIDLINQEYITFSEASRLMEMSEAHCRKLIKARDQGFARWLDDPLLVVSLSGSGLMVQRKAVIYAIEFRHADPKYAPKDLRYWKDYAKTLSIPTSGLNKRKTILLICEVTGVTYNELIAKLV